MYYYTSGLNMIHAINVNWIHYYQIRPVTLNHTSPYNSITIYTLIKAVIMQLIIWCVISLYTYFCLEPITHVNNGPPGVAFGYIARRYYSCVNKINISSCLTTSGYYLRSSFYCSTSRDSLRIDCNVDTSKFFLFACTNTSLKIKKKQAM